MKTKTLKIILAAVTVVSLALAIYCLVVSIKGTGSSWALPAALGLTALGNFINIKGKGSEMEIDTRREDRTEGFDGG